MNICHVITRLIIGGAQENTVLTCRGLHERGHRVALVSGPETGPEGSLWGAARDSGCELVTINSLRRSVRPRMDWSALKELTSLFRRLKPDVVHTHSSKAGVIARRAAARAQVPVIVHTIHGMSFNRTQPLLIRWFYRYLERQAARYTTALVCVADAMTEQAVTAGIAPRERFTTVRSGMETESFAPDAGQRAQCRHAWEATDDEIIVGTIARLFENKGYEEIIKALPGMVAQVPQLKFVWVGDGKHRARYEQQLRDLGLRERVHLVGLIPPGRIPAELTGFDILLHASRWEGLPRVVVQGLLTEVPAVSFDNDGAPEVVIPNETGLLVPYGDTESLTQAVVRLARDADLRRRLGSEGRLRCLEAFDWRKMVAELEALYQRLLPSLAD